MNFEKYLNTYPTKPKKPYFSIGLSEEANDQFQKLYTKYVDQMKRYAIAKTEYHKKNVELQKQFKIDALTEAGLINHPLANPIYAYIWSKTYTRGFEAVYDGLVDIADVFLD